MDSTRYKPGWYWLLFCSVSCQCLWWAACGWATACNRELSHIRRNWVRCGFEIRANGHLADRQPSTKSWANSRWMIAENCKNNCKYVCNKIIGFTREFLTASRSKVWLWWRHFENNCVLLIIICSDFRPIQGEW